MIRFQFIEPVALCGTGNPSHTEKPIVDFDSRGNNPNTKGMPSERHQQDFVNPLLCASNLVCRTKVGLANGTAGKCGYLRRHILMRRWIFNREI